MTSTVCELEIEIDYSVNETGDIELVAVYMCGDPLELPKLSDDQLSHFLDHCERDWDGIRNDPGIAADARAERGQNE